MSSFLNLTDVLREHIVSFLSSTQHHSSCDHLALSASCRLLLQDVESFSRKAMQNVAKEHNVDDDWLVRVGLQAAANVVKRLKSTTNSSSSSAAAAATSACWRVPNSISRRRMLRNACQTHLYSLLANSEVFSFALHPDGTKLLIGGRGRELNILSLWDLTTKQKIQSFIGGHVRFVSNCFFADNKIVSQSCHTNGEYACVWNMDGTRQLSISDDVVKGIFGSIVINQEMFISCRDSLEVIDVNAGETTRYVEQFPCRPKLKTLKGDLFLAFAPFYDVDDHRHTPEHHPDNGDVRVMDSKTLEETSRIKGRQHLAVVSNSNGEVVAATGSGRFDLFHLVGNHLVYRNCFIGSLLDSPHRTPRPCHKRILLFHKSQLYVANGEPEDEDSSGCIKAYNVVTGKLEHELSYPYEDSGKKHRPCRMIATEKELLVGFILNRENIPFAALENIWERGVGFTVKAYLL